ncbi:MAG: hypothetical protein AMJ54_14490 [Deltaproteobacteria bacterium SG8_13]|nr:MAG: hypothetical protein AMJ54_14490 [Deltaproteobacteria bacterium SG8_13]
MCQIRGLHRSFADFALLDRQAGSAGGQQAPEVDVPCVQTENDTQKRLVEKIKGVIVEVFRTSVSKLLKIISPQRVSCALCRLQPANMSLVPCVERLAQ